MSSIFKKMSLVMAEIGHVGKDQKNQAQGFKFRGIDQFVNALYPALVKHGVFMTPRCVKEEHEVKEVVRSNGKAGVDKHVTILMEYDFFAEDGSKVTVGPVPAEGLDSGDKATNKALSAALKYALIQTFSIPTEDMAEADLESPVIGSKPISSSSLVIEAGKSGGLVQVNNSGETKATPVKSGGFGVKKAVEAVKKEENEDGWE
jgi:ERF superfamily